MQLATMIVDGRPTLAVLLGGRLIDAATLGVGIASVADLARAGTDGLQALRDAVAARPAVEGVPLPEAVLAPVVPRPGKIVAVGLNYRAHADEVGLAAPERPLLFAKFSSSVLAHGGEIRWDAALTDQVDYEAELGVVIGQTARNVDPADALDHVLGYTCINDVSARDLQAADGQWVRAKSLDTFCPIGPVLVTADEIPDPQTLAISCSVNGEVLQQASTADMFFRIRELIALCSRSFTLEPGDVIATGTPSGIGLSRKPPRFLGEGDEVVVTIERIGSLANRCHQAATGFASRIADAIA